MPLKKVLITVKTYPTISNRYKELVCTAGFLEDGTWIRLYPIPFRKLDYIKQYKKYDWIEIDLEKNKKDFRPESYRPTNLDPEIKIIDHLDTASNWAKRKKIVLQKVYTNLSKLISEAKDKNIVTSLAVFKPTEILDFIIEDDEREWSSKKKAALDQCFLFEEDDNFELVKKIPYKFYYRFKNDAGQKSTLMIEDWEIGALYWNCMEKYNDEITACKKVKEKYYDDFAKTKDLYLFLGTTQQYHFVSPNPFIIIGTFHPPKIDQQTLFS